MGYGTPSTGVLLLPLSTTIGNGLFEETLWRGVYLVSCREHRFWRFGWASIGFGLWHLVPLNAETFLDVVPMFFGFYLAFLAKKTDSVWWPMVAHLLGGIVMVS